MPPSARDGGASRIVASVVSRLTARPPTTVRRATAASRATALPAIRSSSSASMCRADETLMTMALLSLTTSDLELRLDSTCRWTRRCNERSPIGTRRQSVASACRRSGPTTQAMTMLRR